MGVDPGHAQGHLMGVGLAQDDRSGQFELQHRFGILLRDRFPEELRAGRGGDAGHIKQILDPQRNTQQGQVVQIGGVTVEQAFCGHGLLNRQLEGGSDECVDDRVEPLDLAEAGFGEIEGAQVAVADGIQGGGIVKEERSIGMGVSEW